jgi:Uma2 family endonuclease
VIEILSPGNTNREMKDKFEIYQEAGVKEYWIVEPNDQFILIYTLQKGKYIGSKPYTMEDCITSIILPDFSLDVKEIFL